MRTRKTTCVYVSIWIQGNLRQELLTGGPIKRTGDAKFKVLRFALNIQLAAQTLNHVRIATLESQEKLRVTRRHGDLETRERVAEALGTEMTEEQWMKTILSKMCNFSLTIPKYSINKFASKKVA